MATTVDRIAKLLLQSKSAKELGNVHEAEIFEKKARELIQEYNIEQAEVLALMEDDSNDMCVEAIRVGWKRSVGLKQRTTYLSSIIFNMFNVKCDIARDGTIIYAHGPKNMVRDAQSLIEHLQRSNEEGIPLAKEKLRKERERFYRLSYDQGFFHTLYTLSRKTKGAREEFIKEFSIEPSDTYVDLDHRHSQALALRNMDIAIRKFYEEESTAKGTFSYRQGLFNPASYSAGKQQADNTTLTGQKMLA